MFGIFGSWTNKTGRWPVVTLGLIFSFAAFALILINIPANAPTTVDTPEVSLIAPPNKILALACSVMLGVGTAAANTQVISLLGGVYADNPGPAFAISKCVQSIASSIAFSYADSTTLYVQIPILFGMGVIGTGLFARVDIITRKDKKDEADSLEMSKMPKPVITIEDTASEKKCSF